MDNTSQEFGLFIDSIRSSRNMSREDFVDGIISTRQFQRYLKGESSITNDKIFQLIDRLEMNILNVYKLFINRQNTEYNYISNLYNLIVLFNYKDAFAIINKTDVDSFSSKYNKSFFIYCKITTLYNLKIISKDMAMNQYKNLINYPKCLEYSNINFIELITLISLSSYQLNYKNDKNIAYFLYRVLKQENLEADVEISRKLPSLIGTTCQTLGMLENNDKVIKLAQHGIDICLKSQVTNSLPNLFYYKSLSLLNMGEREKALIEVKKTFMLLEIQNNTEKIAIFDSLLKKHFNISKVELMKY